MAIVTQAVPSRADLEAHDPGAKWREGAEVYCLCPFPACGDHQKPKQHRSLHVNTGTGAYYCHRCHSAGKLTDYWEDRPPPNRKRAKRAAARRALLAPPPAAEAPAGEEYPALAVQEHYAAAFPGSVAARYLEGRGIPEDLAAAAGCGYAPDWYGRPRVTFPIQDPAGRLVALSGRAAVPCDEGDKQRTHGPKRYGVFNPAALSGPVPIITEAPIDALSLEACGYPAAALIGTTAPAWLPSVRVGGKTWLAFDADPPEPDGTPGAGDQAAAELDAALRLTRCVRLRPPDPWKDWNAALCGMGRDALAAWLSERLPAPGAAAAAVTAFEPVDVAEPDRTAAPLDPVGKPPAVSTNVHIPAPAREDLDAAAPAGMMGNDKIPTRAHEADPLPCSCVTCEVDPLAARYPAPGAAGSGELANLLACVRDPQAARYVELLAWREGSMEAAGRCEGQARRLALARVERYGRELAAVVNTAGAYLDGAWMAFPCCVAPDMAGMEGAEAA